MNKRQRKKWKKKVDDAFKEYLSSAAKLACKFFSEEKMAFQNFPKSRENIKL